MLQVYFLHSQLVTATFERRIQKAFHHLFRQFAGNETTRQRHNVGIVVLTRQTRQIFIPAKSATDAAVFVGRHRNTVARTAYENAYFIVARGDAAGHLVREIRIINARIAERTEILEYVTLGTQYIDQVLLHSETGMIATYRYHILFVKHNFIVFCFL